MSPTSTIAGLEERLDDRFARIDDCFARVTTVTFGQEVRAQSTNTLFALVGVALTMAVLALTLVRFA